MNKPPLIVHIIYRLDIGGLETVLVQYLNECPDDKYQHIIISLTEITDFKNRIQKESVGLYSLHKKQGKDVLLYLRMWKLLRRLKPDIVHTYSLSAMDNQFVAFLAGVPNRIHAEHGRSFLDPLGTNKKYNSLRKVLRPVVQQWVSVSRDLHSWMEHTIGIKKSRNQLIYNGIDTITFAVRNSFRVALPESWRNEDIIVIGTIGRLDPVKDQKNLIVAFKKLIDEDGINAERVRLAIIGDGPLMASLQELIETLNLDGLVWLPGSRNDIAELLNSFSLFVLPSIAEGIPMTILEAMASGKPVIATDVGGNSELITDGINGQLIPSQNPEKLKEAIQTYLANPLLQEKHGVAARERAVAEFGLQQMVQNYNNLYDKMLSSDLCQCE